MVSGTPTSQIPFFNRLQVRLIVGFLVVAYLPLGVSGSYAYIQAKSGFEEQVGQNIDGLAHMVRGQISETINVADRQLGVWTTQADALSAPGVYGKTFMIFLLLQKRFRKFLTGQQELLPVFSSILCVQPANKESPRSVPDPVPVADPPAIEKADSADKLKSAASGLAGLFGQAADKAKEEKPADKAEAKSDDSGQDPELLAFLPGAALVMFSNAKEEEGKEILPDFWVEGADGLEVNPRYLWGGAEEGAARPSPVENPFDSSKRVLPIARKYVDAHNRETALVGLVDLDHVQQLIRQTSVAGQLLGERSDNGDTHVAIIGDNGEMVAGVVPQDALAGTSGRELIGAARAIEGLARRMAPEGIEDSFVGLSDTGAEGWTVVGFKNARTALAPIRRLRNANLLSAVLVLGIIFVLGAQLAGRITAPVKKLVGATQVAAAGDLDKSIDIETRDEIGELATSFNRMIQRLRDSFVKLQEQNEELKRLDKLKSEFLANTSHELRTPINGISGLLGAMVDGAYGAVEDGQKRTLTLALKSANRLKTLVDGILDFSAMENQAQGGGTTRRELVDLSDVLGGELMVLFEGLNQTAGLDLSFDVPDDLPPVYADIEQMRQLLTNVIGNAMKFTREGSVWVRARSEGEGAGQVVVIEVQDTGVGIPKDQQQGIFEAFQQVTGSADREFEGTGLGLAIAMGIVTSHGGRIDVDSELGSGSTFAITLPLKYEVSDDALQAEAGEAPAVAALDVSRARELPAPSVALKTEPVASSPDLPSSEAEMAAALGLDTAELQDGGDTDAAASGMIADSNVDAAGENTAVRMGNGELILVVDDEPINVEVLRARLDLVNYRVVGAGPRG